MLQTVVTVISCLSPIIVAYLGYITNKQQKQTKEFIDLQTKFNAANEANKKKEAEEQRKAIADIQNSVKELQDQMTDLKSTMDISKITNQLHNITEISKVNFQYSQSLSQVICAIGDCIDETQSGTESTKNFKEALNKHQDAEREFTNRILKIAY